MTINIHELRESVAAAMMREDELRGECCRAERYESRGEDEDAERDTARDNLDVAVAETERLRMALVNASEHSYNRRCDCDACTAGGRQLLGANG